MGEDDIEVEAEQEADKKQANSWVKKNFSQDPDIAESSEGDE